MTPFEYVSVLISIILGLGITLVLTGVAELIKRWNTSRHFWPYLIWIVLVFVLHLQEWWICYELKSVESWNLPAFLFVISYPILLFILANLLFPKDWSAEPHDFKTFYFNSQTKFFWCTILLIGLSILQNVVLSGYSLKEQTLQFILILIFSGLLIRPTQNTVIHTLLALFMLIAMIASLLLTSDTLVIRQ